MALDRLSQITNSGISTTISFRAAGINVSGIVTASSFVGDGSGLTGVVGSGYEEGSFTFTGNGFTTTPTGTAYYTKIGNQVTLLIPDITGTSNTTTCTISGLPVALRAAHAYTFFARVYNASVVNHGHLYGAHDNVVSVYWDAVDNAFTASSIKGIVNNLSITYTLA